MINLHPNTKIYIDGFYYRMVSSEFVKVGDRVLDMRDGTHGICDFRSGDLIAIKDDDVVEAAVPLSKVKLLELIVSEN